MPQNSLLPTFKHFLLTFSCSLDCCKPLVNFQSSRKVDPDSFCPFSLLLWRDGIWSSLHHHFCWLYCLILKALFIKLKCLLFKVSPILNNEKYCYGPLVWKINSYWPKHSTRALGHTVLLFVLTSGSVESYILSSSGGLELSYIQRWNK